MPRRAPPQTDPSTFWHQIRTLGHPRSCSHTDCLFLGFQGPGKYDQYTKMQSERQCVSVCWNCPCHPSLRTPSRHTFTKPKRKLIKPFQLRHKRTHGTPGLFLELLVTGVLDRLKKETVMLDVLILKPSIALVLFSQRSSLQPQPGLFPGGSTAGLTPGSWDTWGLL